MYIGGFNPFLVVCQLSAISVQMALTWFFLLFLACSLLGREWVAAVAVLGLGVFFQTVGVENQYVWGVFLIAFLEVSVFIVVGLRFGLWSLNVAFFFRGTLVLSVIGLDWSTWYVASTAVTASTLAAVSLFGFWTAKAGRPLLSED